MRRLARGSCRSVEGMRSRGDDKRLGRTVKESSRDGERAKARAREPTSEVALWARDSEEKIPTGPVGFLTVVTPLLPRGK